MMSMIRLLIKIRVTKTLTARPELMKQLKMFQQLKFRNRRIQPLNGVSSASWIGPARADSERKGEEREQEEIQGTSTSQL